MSKHGKKRERNIEKTLARLGLEVLGSGVGVLAGSRIGSSPITKLGGSTALGLAGYGAARGLNNLIMKEQSK